MSITRALASPVESDSSEISRVIADKVFESTRRQICRSLEANGQGALAQQLQGLAQPRLSSWRPEIGMAARHCAIGNPSLGALQLMAIAPPGSPAATFALDAMNHVLADGWLVPVQGNVSLRWNDDQLDLALMNVPGTPAAELAIDVAPMRSLLLEQHPDLAHLPISPFDAGWDNAMFRLGEQLLLRVPRRRAAATLIAKEQLWLPRLPPLPLPIPSPVRVGRPAGFMPWNWSVVPWVEGDAADSVPVDSSEVEVLVGFLRALHQPAPFELPNSEYRGCHLDRRRKAIEAGLTRLGLSTSTITNAVLDAWQMGLAAAPEKTDCWVHGDLHARNVLVRAGKIASVIDWGDLCDGDRATDLAAIWCVFEDPAARSEALHLYGASVDMISRARGWVVALGAILLETGRVDNVRHEKMGADMLRRLSED